MLDVAAAFSARYAEARAKFVAAANALGRDIESHVHPKAAGAEQEPLAIDAALFGEATSASLLVVTSGMHGVEGFAGSGCQVALLHDDAFAAAIARWKVAVLLVHAVNPFGFSHLRRVNEDNVDVNRNFRDFSVTPPPNVEYAAIQALVVPEQWPPRSENTQAIGAYVARHGMRRLQAALTSGQAEFPDGLFYAGHAPAWSNLVLRELLARHGQGRARLGWIDLHTGLGPWGHGERIYNGPDEAAALARARAWYGDDVTSMYDDSSSSALLTGASFHAAIEACPGTECTGITLEFGTKPQQDVFNALRGEQWLANHPAADAALAQAIKRQMRDAFYDERDAWKAMVYGQARATVLQALRALA
jgi:uncharacterized protein DUF2817